MAVNFKVRTQAFAYAEGAKDAYALLVTLLEEGGISNLLEGIANNARLKDVARLTTYLHNTSPAEAAYDRSTDLRSEE